MVIPLLKISYIHRVYVCMYVCMVLANPIYMYIFSSRELGRRMRCAFLCAFTTKGRGWPPVKRYELTQFPVLVKILGCPHIHTHTHAHTHKHTHVHARHTLYTLYT
jgi:hypothetical protein